MSGEEEKVFLGVAGVLVGHNGWVTSIATTPQRADMVISGSRDKTIIVWQILKDRDAYGIAEKALRGHSHYVEDVAISSDGLYALSGSWDATLRLWNLKTGETINRFVGHKNDVMSVAFSANNRQIISASRDRTIKLWNTIGVCKRTLTDGGHSYWVSKVRFSPKSPIVVSCGWDKRVKVWNISHCSLKHNLIGHTGVLNAVCVSPDGSLCASGGKDSVAMLWDLGAGKHLKALPAKSPINSLCFAPTRYWLCAATDAGITVWHLRSRKVIMVIDDSDSKFYPAGAPKTNPRCLSLCWNALGTTLYAGYSDGVIRAWAVYESVDEKEEL